MSFRRNGAMATVGTTRVPGKRWIAMPNGAYLIRPRRAAFQTALPPFAGCAFRAVPRDVSLSGRTLTYTALYDGYGITVRLTVRIMVAGVGLAWAASTQGLPPGTLLLARVKAHMREELARLPNCSCLETVH